MEPVNLDGMEALSPREYAQQFNLPINNMLLLSRALTHRSYLNEHPEALEDNERLEFLGDAVLDFVVGAWLYRHFPEMQEGGLTRLRSALVRTEQLAEFARGINLGQAMRLGRGELRGGGRKRNVLLCGTFEAVVGAIYVDGGIDVAREFIEPLLQPAVEQVIAAHDDQDPKSVLQEQVQSRGSGSPQYQVIASSGPEHEKIFEVVVLIAGQVCGRGFGPSKQAATKAAARSALVTLDLEGQ